MEMTETNNGRDASPGLQAIGRREQPSTEIARHLLRYLLSGHLSPGQKIPSERKLAEDLNIGRSTLREAIKSLSLLGLLDVRQGDGTYLSSSTSDLLPDVIEWGLMLGERRLDDIVETRSHLEVIAAGMAAQRCTPAHLESMRALVEVMENAGQDVATFVKADADFHLELARATGNEIIASLSSSMTSLLRVWATRGVRAAGETSTSAKEHRPILAAVTSGDVNAARAAMSEHMDRAAERLRTTLARS
jgi:GntR family transcriptional repressor for pyruvate dehydrogenase complex